MNILVTGGLGYIGSHTVIKLIENGFNPIIVDNLSNSSLWILDNIENITNTRIKFYNIDCRSKEMKTVFEQNEIDGTIHFAALKIISESVINSLKSAWKWENYLKKETVPFEE